ncbi:unnamed protein product [Nyctereutes procyonoides]|uniref:(raccoon dog) hypothetical protein n=1 Tax=Nyctereutes procyonoides TaxID=34880 RepID=A0A811Y6F2_NYCPR|nr:unnamed protein product [Nyctereutes procyonoides]
MAASCFPEGAGDGNCASQARCPPHPGSHPQSSRSPGPLAPNTSLPLLMSRWPAVPGPSHSSGQVQRVCLPWDPIRSLCSCLKKEKKKKKTTPLQDPCPASPGCIAPLLSGPPSCESGFCATTHLTAPTHKKLAKSNFLGLAYLLCLQLELSRPLAPCAPLSGFPHVVLSWFSSAGSSATWL